jgi:hypothetical protein
MANSIAIGATLIQDTEHGKREFHLFLTGEKFWRLAGLIG